MRTSPMWVLCVLACSSGPVAPKPPDQAKSTVSVDRTTGVVANATDEVLITVTARNGDGEPVPQAAARFELSGTGNEGGNPTPGTDETGVVTHRLRSSKAETKTLTTTLVFDGGEVVLDAKPTVTFVPGPPYRILFTTEPSSVDAGAIMVPAVRVTVFDGKDNISVAPPLNIALRIVEGTPGAVLSGGAVKATVDGGASWDMLSIDRPGTQYGMQAREMGGQGFAADSTVRFDVR